MAIRELLRGAPLAGLVAVATLASAQSCPNSPGYSPDFSANQACLALNTSTSAYPVTFAPSQSSSSTAMRLTPAVNGLESSAWYATPQNVTTGFSTTFSFQIGQPNPYDADGIAFVIQNSGVTALGPGGCGMGYGGDAATGCAPAVGGIPKSVAIAFNTFDNGSLIDPSSNNDVAIQSCGASPNSVDVSSSCQIAYAVLPSTIALTDDTVHTVTVTYTPSASSNCGVSGSQICSSIDVVIDGTDLFPGGVLFDMTSVTPNTAFVGFTAATGGGSDVQDIVSWNYSPMQTETGTVAPAQTTPTTFNYNGGFAVNDPNSGYNFSAQQTTTNQTLQVTVSAIPITQAACTQLVQQNPTFAGAQCFVYQNGGGLGKDSAVLFEVTCPGGSCGSLVDPFYADLGSQFSFSCAENQNLPPGQNLTCPPDGSDSPAGTTFALPHLTPADGLPGVGFLKGEGPDSQHPCTAGASPLFTSNQIEEFHLGDTSGGAKGGSGGTTSCWVMTYHTPGETPSATVIQPVDGGTYTQNQNDSATKASYTCAAVSTGDPNQVPTGPYLTVPPAPTGACVATNSVGGPVANGAQFDTSALGVHSVTVQVQDSAANTNLRVVTYTVVPPPMPPSISGPSSATFAVGSPGTVNFSATGYPVPSFSKVGSLPAGVNLVDNKNGTATLSGTATASGIFPIVISAQNTAGAPATLAFTLTATATVPAAGKCNGVYNGTFKGNLTISAGQTCTFIGGGITGNVTENGGTFMANNAAFGGNVVVSGGILSLGPGVAVKGSVTMILTPKAIVPSQVCGATIGGNLQVLGSSAPVTIGSATPACPGNTIAGSLTVSANNAPTAIYNNTVGGSLLDLANLKPTQVFSNHVRSTLSCAADVSITGGGNTASSKQGQCSKF